MIKLQTTEKLIVIKLKDGEIFYQNYDANKFDRLKNDLMNWKFIEVDYENIQSAYNIDSIKVEFGTTILNYIYIHDSKVQLLQLYKGRIKSGKARNSLHHFINVATDKKLI